MSRFLLWALLLCLASGAQAHLQLRLDATSLDTQQRQASQTLLDEALRALPPHFIERLDRHVEIRWGELPETVYGRLTSHSQLTLNARLLPALSDGSAAQTRTARPHGTVRRELLATVLHELTHLYDRARVWSTEAWLAQRRCRSLAGSLGPVGLPEQCRGQTERRFTLSDDPRLLDLAGWYQAIGQRGEREITNGQVDRSPDAYELANPREFVAVNLEYFLLDPSYPCRRPSLHRYWSEHFGWAPAHSDPCPQRFPYLNAGSNYDREPLGWIDPEQVYAIDYLFADANDNWVSRWGHSMLRLVICAPGRPRSEQCRLDLDHHLVLSYRAFVGDIQLSSWDGLTGAYPSRLFILPLGQVVDEYTKLELRSLSSIPLRLNRSEEQDLLLRAVELHWSYDGDYYFLSNNCAVETLNLLRSGTGRSELTSLDSIMPSALLDSLVARGLADLGPLADPQQALRLGYRFDSFRERYQAMFAILRQRLPIEQTRVEDWLSLPAEARRPWLARADLQASAALLLLEQAAQRQQLLLAQDELKQRYLSRQRATDATLDKAGKALEQMLANSGFLSRPAELLESGYGLPQQAEWQQLEERTRQRQQVLNQLSVELDQDLRLLLSPERRHELESNEANLAQLAEHLRSLHRAAGGLQLP
jgi:hypothetical protein